MREPHALVILLLAHVYPPCHLDLLLLRSLARDPRHHPASAQPPNTRRTATRLCSASLRRRQRAGLAHSTHPSSTRRKGRCRDKELEQCARTNPGQHPESINFIKAPLARKDLLDAIRYPLATQPHSPFRIASGIPRRQDLPRHRRDRLRRRLRPHFAPTTLHTSPPYPPELRRHSGRHGARPHRRLLRDGSLPRRRRLGTSGLPPKRRPRRHGSSARS